MSTLSLAISTAPAPLNCTLASRACAALLQYVPEVLHNRCPIYLSRGAAGWLSSRVGLAFAVLPFSSCLLPQCAATNWQASGRSLPAATVFYHRLWGPHARSKHWLCRLRLVGCGDDGTHGSQRLTQDSRRLHAAPDGPAVRRHNHHRKGAPGAR